MAPIVRRAPAVAPPRRHLGRAAAVMVTEPPGIELAYETVDRAPTDIKRWTPTQMTLLQPVGNEERY
jgi:hypothetical protein